MKIIKYKSEYFDSLLELIHKILGEEYGFKIETTRAGNINDVHDIPSFYSEKGGGFWIAVVGDEVVGSIGLEKTSEFRGCFKRFYTKKEYRRQRIGKKLLDKALKFAEKEGLHEVYASTLSSMQEAVSFYEKNGFSRIEKMPDEMPRYIDTEYFKVEV